MGANRAKTVMIPAGFKINLHCCHFQVLFLAYLSLNCFSNHAEQPFKNLTILWPKMNCEKYQGPTQTLIFITYNYFFLCACNIVAAPNNYSCTMTIKLHRKTFNHNRDQHATLELLNGILLGNNILC